MSKIPSKFLSAVREGREFTVRYRWGEIYQGETEWTDWDKGVLVYMDKANENDEPGINIMDEVGWGYAGREKELEKTLGATIFGRFADPDTALEGPNQHIIQVEFQD